MMQYEGRGCERLNSETRGEGKQKIFIYINETNNVPNG